MRRVIARIQSPSKNDTAIATKILKSSGDTEREALFRFYCQGEVPARIAVELGMTEEVFRDLKTASQGGVPCDAW